MADFCGQKKKVCYDALTILEKPFKTLPAAVTPFTESAPETTLSAFTHNMKQNPLFKIGATFAVMAFSIATSQAALTTTYIGGGTGSASGDTVNAVGPVTLTNNTSSGDMWEGGDEYIYVHSSARVTGSFTATARIIGQSEAALGSWGKSGIRVSNDLTATSAFAMVQAAAGNDSQPTGPNPVPYRLAGPGAGSHGGRHDV
jgi:hypothetical protein